MKTKPEDRETSSLYRRSFLTAGTFGAFAGMRALAADRDWSGKRVC